MAGIGSGFQASADFCLTFGLAGWLTKGAKHLSWGVSFPSRNSLGNSRIAAF